MSCNNGHSVVTDLTISFCSSNGSSSTCALEPHRWHRIEKELYLHTAQQTAWLHLALSKEEALTTKSFVVIDVIVEEQHPHPGSDESWEVRPGGLRVLRSRYTSNIHQAITDIDVLFGIDAVDPRPQWTLIRSPLQLNAEPEVPAARLSIRYGRPKSRKDGPRTPLRVSEDGKFKIVQISDTHMVTGVGVCKEAVDAHGQPLPESVADPLTANFLGEILGVEKPDLVILTGDQLHHDIPDSQTAMFKVVTPMIERSVPYAAVFGNHDDEGAYALSRKRFISLHDCCIERAIDIITSSTETARHMNCFEPQNGYALLASRAFGVTAVHASSCVDRMK